MSRYAFSSARAAVAVLALGVVAGVALIAMSPSALPAQAAATTWSANVRADASDPTEAAAKGQNEPQVAVDEAGKTYVSWQSSPNGTAMSRTVDGSSFTYLGNPDTAKQAFSDVTMATTTWPYPDRVKPDAPGEGGLLFGALGGTVCAPGIAGIRGAFSSDAGKTWTANDAGCQPWEVDRPWTAAYTPEQYRGTTQALSHTVVYNLYHDFAPTDAVWVARSLDGGATWQLPDHLAAQPGTPAQVGSTCNTTPGSIAVDQRGPHKGRVYVAWASSDLPNNLTTGCNYTQAQAFDHLYFSYSDDQGVTWTSGTVFNDPCSPNPPLPPADPTNCQDMANFWTSTAVDDAGTVYQAFPWRDVTAPAPEWDIYVAAAHPAQDGSVTFDKPYRASVAKGTHYSPWIVAGSSGMIDVVDYATGYVEGTGDFNKPAPAPTSALWNVYMSQSLDGGHSFTESRVTDHYNYFGDYCTVGIFCSPAAAAFNWGQDRILYEDFGLAIGPDGGARVAWTDTRDFINATCRPNSSAATGCQSTHVYFACQTGGVGLHGEVVTGCGQSYQPAVSSATPAPVVPTTVAPTPAMPNTSSAPPLVLLVLLVALPALASLFLWGPRRKRRRSR